MLAGYIITIYKCWEHVSSPVEIDAPAAGNLKSRYRAHRQGRI